MRTLRARMHALKRQALLVWFVARHPRLPWHVRGLAMLVAAYAFSPIDLIPDFIPVVGLLDDLLLIPLGVALVLSLTPSDVRDEARVQAEAASTRPVSRAAATVIGAIWLAVLAGLAWMAWRRYG